MHKMPLIFTPLYAFAYYFSCSPRISGCKSFIQLWINAFKDLATYDAFLCVRRSCRNTGTKMWTCTGMGTLEFFYPEDKNQDLQFMWYTRRFALNSWKAFLAWHPVETNTRYYAGPFPTTSELMAWFNWNLKGMENFCQYGSAKQELTMNFCWEHSVRVTYCCLAQETALAWWTNSGLSTTWAKSFLSSLDISPALVTQRHRVKPWQSLSKLICPAMPGHYN